MPEPIYTEKKFGFDMIYIGGGNFLMGSKEGAKAEKPVHEVRLNGFYIGEYPVTQALWEGVMGAGNNPSSFKGKHRPVESVSWYDVAVFCNALNEQCGYAPCYFHDEAFQRPYGKTASGYTLLNEGPVHRKFYIKNFTRLGRDGQKSQIIPGYRLPTEAEWEYAARGGPNAEGRPRYEFVGGDKLDEVCWYRDNSHGETKPVGLKLPNELGIYDMSGNVWEWCEDQWHENYKDAPDDGSAWVDQEQGASRVSRGGSWYDHAGNCRCASRNAWRTEYRNFILGFRLVWVSPPVPVGKPL